MRYINNSHLPRLVTLEELEALRAQLVTVTVGSRGEFIDDHSDAWSRLKAALWTLGSAKCWYSEAVLQEQEGHVEHFRPKKKVHGVTEHKGYWWRAFDWKNLRLAHPTVNMRVTDYLSGKKAGKGSYFPLRCEERRATTEIGDIGEEPLLLDPTEPSDCKLLCFDSENGKPVPHYSKERDQWRHRRAAASIEYYHLDEGTWNYKRKDLMDEVAKLCDTLIDRAAQGPDGLEAYDRLVSELLRYLEPFSEFSSAAFQVACEKGILEHIYPSPA